MTSDVRHCYATKLRERSVPLEDIAQLLGRSRKTGLAVTLKYAHLGKTNLDRAVASLETTSAIPTYIA